MIKSIYVIPLSWDVGHKLHLATHDLSMIIYFWCWNTILSCSDNTIRFTAHYSVTSYELPGPLLTTLFVELLVLVLVY